MPFDFLSGVRVVESSAFIAAPLAGMLLAEMGADVIRVDMAGGGIDYRRLPRLPSGRSLYWDGLNKGKRSVALDLRHVQGRDLLRALVQHRDTAVDDGILLTNVAAPWLRHADLAAARQDLITCTIEGNADGTTAVDYTVNAAVGFPMLTGSGSVDAPVNHVLPAWDIITAQHAANAVTAAIYRRRKQHIGAEIRIALSEVAQSLVSHLGYVAEAQLTGTERTSIGNYVYGAFGRDFGLANGERIMVVAISSRQWRSLVEACDLKAEVSRLEKESGWNLDDEADRFEAREAIALALEPWFAERTLNQAAEALDGAGVCWSRYASVRELVAADGAITRENPLFGELTAPGIGTFLAASSPVRFIGENRPPPRRAPVLGEHSVEVLHETLALPMQQIASLEAEGIIGSAPVGSGEAEL